MKAAQGESVAIAMGLYNGGLHLDEQLASVAAQDHANWSLIISDDGSTDTSADQVRRFASGPGQGRVSLVQGPGKGFAQNYLSLLRHPLTRQCSHVALCDQDDTWLPMRLGRGLDALRSFVGRPALYCARTLVCDVDLNPLHVSPKWPRPFSLRNAMVQNVASGNTIMLNRAMADIAAEAAPAAQTAGIAAHDWWLYQLASASGAQIVQDDQPVLHYRQHDRNTMGRNDTASARLDRLKQILDGTFSRWIDANCQALMAVPQFLEPDAQTILGQFPAIRSERAAVRLKAFRAIGLYRQGRADDMALRVAVAFGRL
ncbi:MAG: glycosyltransferase [Pseudotabrizicola sp.]|uniref:glycosyltransferase n=1 Tax=Pseudotabrizicola sp. TaxID=2939647 RepID=UPI0027239E45|nr:glycosyltransferase [Pseudotabrizicola sp.]MDO8882899.1 glycosyltransferase [Pseudotabrizicola sp.]MDP2080618.1 glycosyltransferase [Pseudotabrizicola sp.]MDZ7573347.1 glycosyltransferase [Pseudotabrizicola sp.]